MRCLGIDIGTSNCKVCVVDEAQRIIFEKSKAHEAVVPSETGYHEQDPEKIVSVIRSLLIEADDGNLLEHVDEVTVTGQMHGIVLWDRSSLSLDCASVWNCSCLVTWMDQRCSQEFLKRLPSSGYGMATLLWLLEEGSLDPSWDSCGTIMDLVTWLLSSTESPVHVTTSDQLAYSWGYLGKGLTWQKNIVSKLPRDILPIVRRPGHIVGKTRLLGLIPTEAHLRVPLGDLQCTFLGHVKPGSAALHIGTSAQLGFCCGTDTQVPDGFAHLLRVPFFDDQVLIIAASLNGGNAINNFIQKIKEWHDQLFAPSESQLDQNKLKSLLNQEQFHSDFEVQPLFLGERHNQSGALIRNFKMETSLSDVLLGIRVGVVRNLARMLPCEILHYYKVTELRLLGWTSSDQVCYTEAKSTFSSLTVTKDNEANLSAAYGAAIFGLTCHKGSK